MLHRVLPSLASSPALLAAPSRLLAAGSPLTFAHHYSTQPSTDEIGPGPGSRSRSLDQAQAAHETSNTSGPESSPARSPDAPADPADLAANRGSPRDPEEVLRSSAWQAQQAMSSSYERDDESLGGATLLKGAPQAAGRLMEKVASAAGIAAKAAMGAGSAMSGTEKAATGSASGCVHLDPSPDASPVSDGALDAADESAVNNPDTAASRERDTAGGTSDADMLSKKAREGGYQEAAERLYDMEGLPRDAVNGQQKN